jgi:hypothetical protein
MVTKEERRDPELGCAIPGVEAYIRNRGTVGTGKQEIDEPYQRTDSSLTRL